MILVNGFEVNTKSTFPDGTLLMKYKYSEIGFHSYIDVEWKYENDGELFALICLTKQLPVDRKKYLILKYIPNARMDRVKNPDDIFTLKYFCEIINSLNYDKVKVLDAHSNVSLALLNNIEQMDVSDHINRAIFNCKNNDDFVLYHPDEGAMKRYSEYNTWLPHTFGIKKRNWEDGKILGVQIADPDMIKGKDVLIVDDICSRGGTFYHSAKALKEAGAKDIYLYITHCENTILDGDIFTSGLIKQVYTTNSLVHCNELKEKLIYV